MKIKFYGTRGSIPVCHPDFLEFGGNTTCLKVEFGDGAFVILDAGTGIRDLGQEITHDPAYKEVKQLYILFTHFHWDHIQGFPFFSPAYDPETKIHILALGRGREINCLEEIFATQMQKEFFPVQLDNMGARFNFLLYDKPMEVFGDIEVKALRHKHPGGAYSYRIEENGRSFVFCTDIEHGEVVDEEVIEFCRHADLLIHDAQYTNEELSAHQGWGHSSYDQALEVAERAEVKRLILTHHDPSHSDVFLQEREKECRLRFEEALLARENMEVEV